jgi:mRNA-degrading endonuclease RelE of RelBE toxin-antitoxin system
MYATDIQLLEKLDEQDREKAVYFLKLLLEQEKYRKTKAELRERSEEIQRGDVLTNEEIWSQ